MGRRLLAVAGAGAIDMGEDYGFRLIDRCSPP
jgi:hypothetical protein